MAARIDVFDSSGPDFASGAEEFPECAVPHGYEADLRIYLRDDATERELVELYQRVSAIDGVKAVYYITSQEELRAFKDTFRHEPELWETLGPDSLPASFRVVLVDQHEDERIALMVREWSRAVDDVSWGRMTQEQVEQYFHARENVLPPTICPREESPGRSPDGEGFTPNFVTEPVTFSGEVEGVPWSLSVRTAKSSDGEIGFCGDWSYGPGLNSGMDCIYTSPSVVDDQGRPWIDVATDSSGRDRGHPLAFFGTVPGNTAAIELAPADARVQPIEMYDVQDELEIPVKVVVGFSTTQDARLRAYDENGEMITERRLNT